MYNIGIEREGLRCTEEGELSDEPHPRAFGDRNKNAFITTDFGAAQLELRTPICKSTKECYEKLENITNVVINELNSNNELLWPYSMPCILPNVKDFKFGNYGENTKEKEYEKFLFKKYGFEMYCMSGVHLNFSIDLEYYKKLVEKNSKLPKNIDDAYFKIIRNYLKKVWMLIYLFGATPRKYEENGYENKCSIRNSYKEGFKNLNLSPISYNDKKSHIESIEKNIKDGNISAISELYVPIRIKNAGKNNINKLKSSPIDHIELRVFDLDPFDKCSISLEQMDFIVAFLFCCLLSDENNNYDIDYRKVAEDGINEEQRLIIVNEIKAIQKINKKYSLGFGQSISKVEDQFYSRINTAQKINKIINEKGYIKGLIDLAKDYRDSAEKFKYSIKYKNNIVSSVTATLIKDAIIQGIDYNFIDFKDYDSLIEFSNGTKSEYIIGATRTSKDNLIITYITDDKFFAKELMKENNIRVPNGTMISKKNNKSELQKVFNEYVNKRVVVKPRNTNSGTGITVFSKPASLNQLKEAVKYAFKFDAYVLLEEYIEGNEYRFIVINGKCINVALRRSARVVGNGNNTIKELISMKNHEDWHILLKTKIKIDVPLKQCLKQKKLTLDYIPKKGEIIYLRENSNCSTGGESINVTNKVPEYFKKSAEKASKIFKAHICGVDMIINDLSKNNYAVLEVNNDPGYDINEWPYEGEDSKIGIEILKMLKLTNY